MVRTNQGGSILSFLVIGGVMVLLLVGGAYAVRHFLFSPDRSPEVASRQDEDTPRSGSAGDGEKQPSGNTETPKKDETESEPKTSSNKPVSDQPSESRPQDNSVGTESEAPGDLPTTGPTDTVLEGVFLSSLVAFAAAYLRSRRLVAPL